MNIRWLKKTLPGLLLVILLLPPATLGQAPPPAPINLYSVWVRMSLRGFNQEEIESYLRHLDPKTIIEVKSRLRKTVLGNLELKKIKEQYLASRDSDDLRTVRASIETEIRFAGMQSDPQLREMIKDQFGISLKRL